MMKKVPFFLIIAASAVLLSTNVSAQVQIDKDIQLNGTAGNRDITGAETVDVSTGYLVGGSAAAGRYLRGNGTHYVSSPLLASDLSGTISNAQLATSSLTVTAGTGMSGGGSVALGGSVTLNNAGVTSLTGTANRVTVSASTGAITISAPQNIHTGASPTFAGMTLSGLGTNSAVYTNGSSGLTTTAPATGTLGYWTRTGTDLSPATLTDNIGLGTAAPTEMLHLSTTGSARIRLEADTDNNSGGESDQPQILFSQDGGTISGLVGYSGGTNHMRIENNYANADADIDFVTQTSVRMTIDGSGNVGIGTTTPNNKLQVAGDVNVSSGSGFKINNAAAAGEYLRGDGTRFVSSAIQAADIPSGSAHYIQNTTSQQASSNFNISSNGTIGGTLNFGSATRQMLNLYGTSYALGVQSSTQYYRSGSNFAWFKGGTHSGTALDPGSGGTLHMVLDGSGNLGLGLDPTVRLHVRYGSANTSAATPALVLDNPSGGSQTSMQFRINNAEKGRIRSDNSNNLIFSTAGTGDYYLRSGTDATELMFINGGTGLVGIATTSPLSDLDIAQSGGSASAQQTGGINLRNASYQWRIYNSNDFVRFNYSSDNGASYTAKAYINSSNGSWNQLSDASLKKNITPMPGVLANVLKLNPVEYQYIDNKEGTPKSMGFLAQEAQALFPTTVSHEKDESLLGIDYASFSVIAIKAIQEQQKIIEDLQQTVEELKEKLK